MLNINELMNILNQIAPLSLSKKLIEKGDYDNSGIIVNGHENINGIMFALDLTEQVVKRAKRLKCDTIITHHPAIYYPISSLDANSPLTKPILLAIENKINVISMHLNLDIAKLGIDYYLAYGLGATKANILDLVEDGCGYGREFCLNQTTLSEFVKKIKAVFGTQKVLCYGSKNTCFNKVASFCGAGASHAQEMILSGKTNAEVIVTSEMPHHILNQLIGLRKSIVLLTHYASENYGFKRFFESVSQKLNQQIKTYFYEDKRLL